MKIEVSENQRQLILMALGALHTQAPGFDFAMTEVANILMGETLYEAFKKTKKIAAEENRKYFKGPDNENETG